MTKKLTVKELYEAYKDSVRQVKQAEELRDSFKQQLFSLVPRNEAIDGCKHYHETYQRIEERKAREAIVAKLVPKTKLAQVEAIVATFTVTTEREGIREA